MAHMTDIGALLKNFQTLSAQALDAAGNGAAVDRLDSSSGFLSGTLILSVGVTTGTPTSFSVEAKLQHSDSSSSGFTDYSVDGTVVTTDALTSASTSTQKNFTLLGAKRYLRAVVTPTFVGGTTPTIVCYATLVLGGARVDPVS